MATDRLVSTVARVIRCAFVLSLLLAVAAPAVLHAQVSAAPSGVAPDDAPTQAAAPIVAPAKPDGPPERNQETPRNAAFDFVMLGREGNWKAAATHLEAPPSGWPEAEDPERLARALKTILDTRLWLDFDSIPDERTGVGAVDPRGRVSLGEVVTDEGVLEVKLVRLRDEWYFAPETVAAVPTVARGIGSWWITALP
jgi:hypothetical protein